MRKAKILAIVTILCLVVVANSIFNGGVEAQKSEAVSSPEWASEIEKVFIRSEDCKQCHDRHYEEWKGIREQTPDLKTFGRVDAALLHGTALESPVFRTVLGLWLQTNPTSDQRARCLSCHAPAATVFPQYVDKINAQVLAGKVDIEGIGCASCHLISGVSEGPAPPPSFKLHPGKVIYGPYPDPEENLVHPSTQSDIYRGANFCTACHFDKVKDPSRRDLPGEILQGTICQDCHMEPSTGSSTSKRGAMTRGIGRHWFRGVVIPGIMLKNRNLQAEWMPRVDIEASKAATAVDGTVLVRTGSLPHSFPDGDPVLKQFFITINIKGTKGETLTTTTKQFGRSYEEILRGPIPDPLIKGGTTHRIPFHVDLQSSQSAATVEVLLSYALIPNPSPTLKKEYLGTLKTDKEREQAIKLIEEYTQPRMLTFRTKVL
jgi:hypothetical protein